MQVRYDAERQRAEGWIQPQCGATWIEFRLVDQDGSALIGAKYKVVLPEGSTMQGGLDQDGKVRFENIVAGQAAITFPEFDGSEWQLGDQGSAAATSGAGA